MSNACNPMDCSLPGSSVHGVFQARVLEWVVISISRGSSKPRNWTRVSCTADRVFTTWATRKVVGTANLNTFISKRVNKALLKCTNKVQGLHRCVAWIWSLRTVVSWELRKKCSFWPPSDLNPKILELLPKFSGEFCKSVQHSAPLKLIYILGGF